MIGTKGSELHARRCEPYHIALVRKRSLHVHAVLVLFVVVLVGCSSPVRTAQGPTVPVEEAVASTGPRLTGATSGNSSIDVSGESFSVTYATVLWEEADGLLKHHEVAFVLLVPRTVEKKWGSSGSYEARPRMTAFPTRVLVRMPDVEFELPLGCLLIYEDGHLNVLADNCDRRCVDSKYLQEFIEALDRGQKF